MSNESTTSSIEDSNSVARTVLDFLYYDRQRVGSFLSQFYPEAGLRSGVKSSQSTQKTEGSKGTATGEGRLAILKLGASGERTHGSTAQRSFEDQFDPLWANALEFITLLEAYGLLHREIAQAGLGQIVQVTGTLDLSDTALTYRMLKNKDIQKLFSRGPKTEGEREKQMQMDVLSELPQLLIGTMKNGGREVWCNLDEGSLTMSPGAIMLKHGPTVAGQWTMIGVLDARAGEGGPLDPPAPEQISSRGIVGFDAFFAIMARRFFGRPKESHGVTPLLIYREVKALGAER